MPLTLSMMFVILAASATIHEFDLNALFQANRASRVRASLNESPHLEGGGSLQFTVESGEELVRLEGAVPWTRGRFLALDVYYDSEHAGTLRLEFYARGEPGTRLSATFGIFPRLRTRLAFPLDMLDNQRVFLDRAPVRLKGVVSGRGLSREEISHATLSIVETGDRQTIHINNVVLLDREPEYSVPGRVVVDELGQWTERDWPGKTTNSAALKRQLENALQKAASASYPEAWSQFGGSRRFRFEPSGYFRTHHDGKRWWLVDPEGYAFFSAGLDSVRPGEAGAIPGGTEKLFRWLPDPAGSYADAYGRAGSSNSFMFGVANLIRAFADRWFESWTSMTRARMVEWRFNTVANWSEPRFIRASGLPYVIPMQRFPSTPTLLFRDFPDVFSPDYRAASIAFAKQLEPYKFDPLLVGYFLSNEPKWGFGRFNLAAEMLERNPGTHTRRELARWLGEKYRGDVASWSKAWSFEFKSFAQVESETFQRMGERSKAAYDDLWEFSRAMVEAYVRVPCEEVRKSAPHHLNLGLRYASISSDLFYAAGEYFDVFSINSYSMEPPAETVRRIAERTRKPVLVGEYHFGALDRGLPATGLRGVASQEDRGLAYRRYFELAAADPDIVGAHYFILNDQALLGRFDGENYQIGFVDVCHTPYPELVRHATLAHEAMYEIRAGLRSPFEGKAREVPRIK